jgi:hypothetical protein
MPVCFQKKLIFPFSTVDKHISVLLKLNLIEAMEVKKTGGYFAL